VDKSLNALDCRWSASTHPPMIALARVPAFEQTARCIERRNGQFLPAVRKCPHAAALPLGSDIAFGWRFVELTTRVHPFVQHADGLDHIFLGDAIVENVNRSPDLCACSGTACRPDVETADTGTKVGSLPSQWPLGLSRDLSHGGDENGCVPLPAFAAPPLSTCRRDVGKIDLRWASESKPYHAA
jgi:hypothetical protein